MTLDRFYPIVDSADWVRRLVGVGARLIQLRMKDKDQATIVNETREALAVCRAAGAALVVNDFWRVAIDEGAPWVHLGQGDLDDGADSAPSAAPGSSSASAPTTKPSSSARWRWRPTTSRWARSIRRS